MNRIRLSGRLIAVGALRYTPAGMPVAEATLRHLGSVVEAGTERQLDFELAAVAVGDAAQTLAARPLGADLEIDGFVAPTRRGGRRLVLHITEHRKTSGD